MVRDTSTPLPRWAGYADDGTLTDGIAAWAGAPAMRELVDCFGEVWPAGGLGELLAGLVDISGRHWDFRAGRERADVAVRTFDADTTARIRAAVAALGMRQEAPPPGRRYDHLLIHGGLLASCLTRARYAAGLLADRIAAPAVCGLGSFRPTSATEAALAGELGLDECPDEVSAMDLAVRAAFGPLQRCRERNRVVPGRPHRSFLAREYRGAGGLRVGVVAAPSSDPDRRANTADTCAFWADRLARPRPGQRVLLVTTDLYVPFQHYDAIRVLGLGYGCTVETVGVDPAGVPDPRLRRSWPVASHLQEVRSAIRSAQTLHAALATR